MKRLLSFVLFFVFPAVFCSAQNNCDQSIKQAEELFIAGDYDNCIQLIEKANKDCHFSKKKKELMLELLTKAYLEQDNLVKAEKSAYSILKNNPYYELKENADHEDFEILINKFDINPVFSVGARNTAMRPDFKTIRTYAVLDNLDYSAPYETNETILLYYIIAEYGFKRGYSLNADVISYDLSYSRTMTKNSEWRLDYIENLSFVEVPVYLKKYFTLGKNFSAYASAGGGYLRMLHANADAGIEYTTEDLFNGSKTEFYSASSADMLGQRNKNTFEWLAGTGVGFRFRGLGIFLDARYTGGINSFTNPSRRYDNNVFVNDYFYVDNSVRINKFEVGLSLSYTLKNAIKKVR